MADEQGEAEKAQAEATTTKEGPEAGNPREKLGGVMGALLRRGRSELERMAVATRFRLDLRQLHRDKDAMYQKLGREVRALLEGGELSHPGLARGVDRIRELEAKIHKVEGESLAAGVPPEPDPTPEP